MCPNRNLKFVYMVGESKRLANVSSAPCAPKLTFSYAASDQSLGTDLVLVKLMKYELLARPSSLGQVSHQVSESMLRVDAENIRLSG